MSNFYTDAITRVAKKDHKCTYCSERIDIASTSKPVFAGSDCDGGSRAGYSCFGCGQSDCNGDCMGDGLMGGQS